MSVAVALLVLRIALGLIVAAHGSQKLFGWFGGNGFIKTVGFMKAQGFQPAWLWTLLGGLGEFGGGVLLVLGLLSPLAGAAIFAAMLMAVLKFHWSKGFWNMKSGYEYPLVLGLLGAVLALTGPGSYSLDALLGFALATPLIWLVLVLAALVVIAGIATSRQAAAKQATA